MGRVAKHHRRAAGFPLLLGDLAHGRALRVDLVGAIHVRPAILFTQFDLVDLLGLHIVAQEVDAMVEAPQLARRRMPGVADQVAQAAGKDGALLAVRRNAQQCGVFGIAFVAGIAGAAHAQVQHAVRAEGHRAVRVLARVGQVADQHLEFAQAAILLDVGHEQLLDRYQIQLVVADRQAVCAGAVGHRDRFAVGAAVIVGVAQQQHVALVTAAHIDVAAGRDGDDAGVFQAGCERAHREAGRRLECTDPLGRRFDLVGLPDVDLGGELGAVALLGGGGAEHEA